MEYGWEFVWSVVASSAGTSALLVGAAFLFRSQISHWLNKDLEGVKAGYQRDLESYKVGLIAQAERAKAQAELKRAAALRTLEFEFEALKELHAATLGLGIAVSGGAQKEKKFRSHEHFQELLARYKKLERAVYSMGIFVDDDERQMFTRYERAVTAMMFPHCNSSLDPIDPNVLAPLRAELFRAENAVDSWISERVSALRALD